MKHTTMQAEHSGERPAPRATWQRAIHTVCGMALLLLTLQACTGRTYRDGPAIIVKKQQSMLPGKCLYTYEGFGREEMFDDTCDKYNVGDTLK
ncbi:MAG: hypothetical protein R2817_00740 [Flavobacteriales bacterium]